jgi:hypothetical protein
MTHAQVAELLNRLFPNIEARSGYIGNCSPIGKYDDRLFRIFTNIDVGGWNSFSIDLPAGDAGASDVVRCVLQVLRWDKRQEVSPSVAQMLNAVRHAA